MEAKSPTLSLPKGLIFLGHLGAAGLALALSGGEQIWLIAAVLQAAAGVTLGLLHLQKPKPVSVIILPPTLVWLAGLAISAASLVGLARHVPRLHPLTATSTWYAGLGKIELALSAPMLVAALGFLAALCTFAARSRANARGLSPFVLIAPLSLLAAVFVVGFKPSLSLASIFFGAGLLLLVLVGKAPGRERMAAGLALAGATFCMADAELLWTRAALLSSLESVREAGALSLGDGLLRLDAVDAALTARGAFSVAAALAVLILIAVGRSDEEALWRSPLALLAVVLLAVPIGFAVKAGDDARKAGMERALEREVLAYWSDLPPGGALDRVDVAPLIHIRGDKLKLDRHEHPVALLDDTVLLKETLRSTRAALFEKVHEDLPAAAGFRPPADRASVVLSLDADAPIATFTRAARGLAAADVKHLQLLLQRGEPNAPLNDLPPGFGMRASLDVPRVLHVELTDAPATGHLRPGPVLRVGEKELRQIERAMSVVDVVGAASDAFVLDISAAEDAKVVDLVRVLDPVRALLQRPVRVSTARAADPEDGRALAGDREVKEEADRALEAVPVEGE